MAVLVPFGIVRADDTLFRCLLDHGLMYLPWNIALGKFGKGPRKGGFTWYFRRAIPTRTGSVFGGRP